MRRILMAQLNANGIPLQQLFLTYGNVTWDGQDATLDDAWKATGITPSRMNEVTVWINSPKD